MSRGKNGTHPLNNGGWILCWMISPKFNDFCAWMISNGLKVSDSIEITSIDSFSNYGVKAMIDIQPGTCLFTIPRSCLLSVENGSLNQLIVECKEVHSSESGWIPLLLTLAYESTNPDSKWAAYLKAVPNFENLELPLFWKQDELESYCSGTGIVEAVTCDNVKIESEFYEKFLPFVRKHHIHFQHPLCQNFEFYKKLVAFVMAYSFTEPEKDSFDYSSDQWKRIPFMVPMADMLNHSTPNNAALIFDDHELKMESILPIQAGQEVFNTYGDMANWQLLHMHGFSLPPGINNYDSFELSLDLMKMSSNQKFQKRWTTIQELHIQPLISYAPVDSNGFMNTEELALVISIIFNSADLEFESWTKEYIQHSCSNASDNDEFDPWESIDEDVALAADHLDSVSTLCKLPSQWKEFLVDLCLSARNGFKHTLAEDEAYLENLTCQPENNKMRHALYVQIGQLRLLNSILNALQSN